MNIDCVLIRYGDTIAELEGGHPRFDSLYGYSEQYEYALPKNSVIIGKRARWSKQKVGEKIYYTFPLMRKSKIAFRLARIFCEIYEFFLLLKFRAKVVVVVGGPIDMLIPFLHSRIFHIPMVAVFHDEILPRGIINKISAKIANSANVFTMTNGELSKDQLVALGVKPEKIDVHRIYYPPEFFTKKTIEPEIEEADKFKVVFAGRFNEVKGIMDVIEIAKIVKEQLGNEIIFFLIGDGAMREQVEKKISEYGLSEIVKILGMRSSDMMFSYLSAADVAIVPSYIECFGKILAEAMISGTPSIAYATGGLKYQIEDGVNGFLVPTGDFNAMAERIVELYKNPDMRKKIAENSLKIRNKYTDIEKTLGYKLKKIIEKILNG